VDRRAPPSATLGAGRCCRRHPPMFLRIELLGRVARTAFWGGKPGEYVGRNRPARTATTMPHRPCRIIERRSALRKHRGGSRGPLASFRNLATAKPAWCLPRTLPDSLPVPIDEATPFSPQQQKRGALTPSPASPYAQATSKHPRIVMAGLVPAIHALLADAPPERPADARDKRRHDAMMWIR